MLTADAITHIVRVAPWSALNALRRSCRAAAGVSRDEFVTYHLTTVSMETMAGTWTGTMLPNGLRHGVGVTRTPHDRIETECVYGLVVWARLTSSSWLAGRPTD